jgi:hypothetical protein
MQELLCARRRHVEQAAFVVEATSIARCVVESCLRDKMPFGAAPAGARWKAVAHELRDENDRPLQSLGLVYGHDPYRVGANKCVVLPPFRVGTLGVVTQEAGEACVLLDRF